MNREHPNMRLLPPAIARVSFPESSSQAALHRRRNGSARREGAGFREAVSPSVPARMRRLGLVRTQNILNDRYFSSDKFWPPMQIHTVRLSREGRVLIPAEVRSAMGLSEGSHLSLSVQDGEIRLFDRAQALRRARDIARKYKKSGNSVVDELLQERRAEAGRE